MEKGMNWTAIKRQSPKPRNLPSINVIQTPNNVANDRYADEEQGGHSRDPSPSVPQEHQDMHFQFDADQMVNLRNSASEI
jgi:hypothetical protein